MSEKGIVLLLLNVLCMCGSLCELEVEKIRTARHEPVSTLKNEMTIV